MIAHGVLARRWGQERQLRAQYLGPYVGLAQDADPDRVHQTGDRYFVAFYFFLMPDEIMAERALRDRCGPRLPERLRQHIEMRASNLHIGAQDQTHPQMRKYWLALELQRADMMIDLADAGSERSEFKTIRETYRALLAADAGNGGGQRLVALVERISRYQVGDPDSEVVCDEAFAEIMASPYLE